MLKFILSPQAAFIFDSLKAVLMNISPTTAPQWAMKISVAVLALQRGENHSLLILYLEIYSGFLQILHDWLYHWLLVLAVDGIAPEGR